MAKKKTEGLLMVDVPDLFAGLDLFEEGWQTAIIGAPDIAVAAATEELPEIFAAIAEPVPVTDEPIEVSLDSIFGEEEVHLLDQAVSPVSPAGATISVAAGPAGSQPLPAWRERESILEDIGRTERAVVLQRIGRRAVTAAPTSRSGFSPGTPGRSWAPATSGGLRQTFHAPRNTGKRNPGRG